MNNKNKDLQKYYKKNVSNILSLIKNNNIKMYLKEIQEKIENGVLTLKKIRDYIYDTYYYPEKNYEIANKPISLKELGNPVGLVLSGGGARGIAHAGILKVLEEKNIKPAFIVGTSAGALTAVFYGSGYDAETILNLYKAEEKKFFKLSNYKYISQKTMTKILREILNKYLKIRRIENSKLPIFLNTADVKMGKRVIFSSGDIVDLTLASSAVPFLFEPIIYQDYFLVDGGVIDNFCVDIAREINRVEFDNKLKILISDVSAATDITSPVNTSHFLLNLSKEFTESVKLIGNNLLPITNKKDMLSFVNNLLYMLKKRGGLAPEVKENEFVVTPLLEKMGVFEFKKYLWAYEKGIETANMVFKK